MPHPHWARRAAVVAGYVLIAVVFTWPLAQHLGTDLTGDPGGDTGVYVWNQWVFQHEALVEGHNPLTTERILSLGARADLSQHNYTAFLDLLALPLIPWLGVVAAFNIVLLATTVITAIGAYALTRRAIPASRPVAWLAGVVFAWSPVLVARTTGHASLVAAAPLPVFVLCLLNAGRSRSVRDAALAGACVAWAALCDPYYAVYCLMLAGGYLAGHVVRVGRAPAREPIRWHWIVDLLIVLVAGLVVGLALGRGGQFEVFGIRVAVRGLYTPVLLLTVLVTARITMALRPRVTVTWRPSLAAIRLLIAGVLACAGPLSPVLYGLGERIMDGRFVSPPTYWRSSPRGVDLLALVTPNPNHPLVRSLAHDWQGAAPSDFIEFTGAQSLVAIALVAWAVWRAGYRPRAGWWWLTIGFAALALGPFVYFAGLNTHVPGPWALLRYLPVVSAARSPTRFAVVVSLGVAVLLAGALEAIGRRWPQRRGLAVALAGVAVCVELCPVPRTLFAATIPSVYDVIAADLRPVRVLELPAGVRDGVSSDGNFSARYQFNQTRHGKPLVGGYLSRISRRRVSQLRAEYRTYDGLMLLSEGRRLTADVEQRLRDRGPSFIARTHIGYVVIHHDVAPPALVRFARDAWGLVEVARDGPAVLYRPTVGPSAGPPLQTAR